MSPNREAMLKLRAKWKADGKCSRCGGPRERFKTCTACRLSDSRNIRNTPVLKTA